MFQTSVENDGVEQNELERLFKDGFSKRWPLNDHIEVTVKRMSYNVQETEGHCCHKRVCVSRTRDYIKRLLPLLVLFGYYVYTGFVLYLNPTKSAFVCIVGVFMSFVCINLLMRGKLKRTLSRLCHNAKKYIKPKDKRIKRWFRRISTIVIGIAIIIFLVIDLWDAWRKWIPLAGLAVFVMISIAFSKHPRQIIWTPVLWGIFVQFGLGLLILRWEPGFQACQWVGKQVTIFLGYTDKGSEFVFGEKYIYHPVAFKILPVVIFFSSVVSVLYYLGTMQIIIKSIALLLQVTLHTTPIESFGTAAHIFIGQVESSVALKPFWMELTESELHAIMTSGFATVAGTIIAAYVEFGVPAEHVISASFMSAPAALAIAKLSIPETQVSKIKTQKEIKLPSGQETNMIEALSVGATTAVKLVAFVVVNLIAFFAVLNFLDATLSYFGAKVNCPELSFQLICSYIFMPLAAVIGVQWSDTKSVGALIGKKIVINEFLAYADLGKMIQESALDERSVVLATYILCGFGSLAALGINLGSLSSVAPDRRSDFARLSVRSMINGNIACFMTACVAGLLYQDSQQQISTAVFLNNTEVPLHQNVTIDTTLSSVFKNATLSI